MIDPVSLMGMDPPSIGRMLGAPAQTRQDAMTTEWAYMRQNCSLKIYFYPDIATGALRALKYNVSDITAAAGDVGRCAHNIILAGNDDRG